MSKHFRFWHVIHIKTRQEAADSIANRCFELNSCGVEHKGAVLSAYFDGGTDVRETVRTLKEYCGSLVDLKIIASEPEITASRVSEEDWAENWKRHFTPVRTGKRLLIVPPWRREMTVRGRITIIIDPGMAFGTGKHASTELALVLMERYVMPDMAVWDIGAGSGILSIAAVKLGAGHVYAIDPEPGAVAAARNNMALNGVSSAVAVEQTGVENAPERAFGLVAANLNRSLIHGNAEKIAKSLLPGGVLIVSGLEGADEPSIMKDFTRLHLVLSGRKTKNTWTCLAFERQYERSQ